MVKDIQMLKGANGLLNSQISGRAMQKEELEHPAACYTGRSHSRPGSRASQSSLSSGRSSRTKVRDKINKSRSGSKLGKSGGHQTTTHFTSHRR